MREITILVFGDSGVGKSELGNAILQNKNAFLSSNSPESCTTEVNVASNIDTQGLSSSDGKDREYQSQMPTKLNEIRPAINLFIIVINLQNPRFDRYNSF